MSKIADNAARIAALFHLFDGAAGPIQEPTMNGACTLCAWHLHESKRFFGALAMPQELVDAERLDAWLIARCRTQQTGQISTRDAQRYGPIRDSKRLEPALAELHRAGRARIRQDGKRRLIELNPALLTTTP